MKLGSAGKGNEEQKFDITKLPKMSGQG